MACIKGLIRVYSKESGTYAYIPYPTSCDNSEALAEAQAKFYRDYLDKIQIIEEEIPESIPTTPKNPNIFNEVSRDGIKCNGSLSLFFVSTNATNSGINLDGEFSIDLNNANIPQGGITFNGNIAHSLIIPGKGGIILSGEVIGGIVVGGGVASLTRIYKSFIVTGGIIAGSTTKVTLFDKVIATGGIRFNSSAVVSMGRVLPNPDINRAFYNIEEYGAVIGGDITEVLQTAFNFDHKTTIYIPAGYYYVFDTITVPASFGGTVFGAGDGGEINKNNDGSVARLIWAGARNKPIFEILGSGLSFAGGLTLDGKDYLQSDSVRASIGILVDPIISGNISNSLLFNSLTVMNCDVLLQINQTEPENGCLILIDTFKTGGSCNNVCLLNNDNSSITIINLIHSAEADITFNVYKNSPIFVMNGICTSPTKFLNIPADSDDNMTQSFNFGNIAVDTDNGFKAVYCENNLCRIKVIFNNLSMFNIIEEEEDYTFKLTDATHLVLQDCYNIQNYMVYATSNNYKPSIYLYRCSTNLSAIIDIMESHSNNYHISARNCLSIDTLTPINDYQITT